MGEIVAGHPSVVLYTDGASKGNPGPAGLGVVMKDLTGTTLMTHAEGLGVRTNNYAEWMALLVGLRLAARNGAKNVLVRTDSMLVAKQFRGEYRIKNGSLQKLRDEVFAFVSTVFAQVEVEHIPREKNREADFAANVGSRLKEGQVQAS